jgi:hypothetical protein
MYGRLARTSGTCGRVSRSPAFRAVTEPHPARTFGQEPPQVEGEPLVNGYRVARRMLARRTLAEVTGGLGLDGTTVDDRLTNAGKCSLRRRGAGTPS